MSKMICTCIGVYADTIKEAVSNGADSLEEVEEMTEAGSCCGACVQDISRILLKK
ncbi:MAG: (2Fe-2S)-binding protein [Clostridium sp.]|uniref:(2Fe-2S)-binding protein n=1 Tax=Clostridium sp. TaxID=1506 RepID=UPI003EE51EAC